MICGVVRLKMAIAGTLFFVLVFAAGLVWSDAHMNGLRDCFLIKETLHQRNTWTGSDKPPAGPVN